MSEPHVSVGAQADGHEGAARYKLRAWHAQELAQLQGWRNQLGVALAGAMAAPAQDAAEQGLAPAVEGEWLVLAEVTTDQPQACLRLVPKLGLSMPRYSFHLGRVVHAAAELALFRAQSTLMLGNDHTGESELADLACAPGVDAQMQVALLQQLIEIARQRILSTPGVWGERLIVELAGPRDPLSGASPFWQGLGAHFYAGDPEVAQARWGAAWRSHLAALLPRQTVYLSFLSEAAQAAVGQLGPAAQVAAQALAAQGFGPSRHIAIDDGGPIWELRLPPQAITRS